jgi:Tfp pilus assembly protein PilP
MKIHCTLDGRFRDQNWTKGATYDIEDAAEIEALLAFEYQVAGSVLHPFVDAAGVVAETEEQAETARAADAAPKGPLEEMGLEQLRAIAKQHDLAYKGKTAAQIVTSLREAGVGA